MENNEGASASRASRRNVFGSRLRPDQVVGRVTCPHCRRELQYRLGNVGGAIDCPACHYSGIRIGQNLLDTRDKARSADEPPIGVLIFPKRWQPRRMAAALVVMLLITAAAGGGFAFTLSGRLLLSQGWLGFQTVETQSALPATSTAEVDASELTISPPEITLDAIERLLEAEDLRQSLVQAQVWQQMLRDFGADESEPRLLRLTTIIQKLTEQFRQRPGPPPAYLTEFRDLLKKLRDAVIAEDLASARTALASLETLLEAHSAELAAYGRSYLALKQRFSQLERRQEGRGTIRRLLAAADQFLKSEKPLEAAEAIAKAMFLALRTPMEKQEFDERNATVVQLQKELRFARGKRAVLEAEQCQTRNDLKARDAQLQIARDLLPDLPASRVEDLLKRAGELAKKEVESPADSDLGRQIRFRAAYEEALDRYGRRGAMVELVEECARANALLDEAPALRDQQAKKVADLILNALESEVGDLLSLPAWSPDVAPGLALVREALDRASPWKTTPRWRSVDEAVNAKGDEVAVRAIDVASKRMKDDLAAALRIIEPARTLGSPASRQRADRLHREWQADLASRSDLVAQAEAWAEILSLHRQGSSLDAWRLLDEFATRFPGSARQKDLEALRLEVRPNVDQAAAELERQIVAHLQQEQWPEFRQALDRWEAAPLKPEQQARLKEFKQTVERKKAEGSQLYLQSQQERYKLITNPTDTLKYLSTLRAILNLDPDHEKAAAELTRAQTRAKSMAQGFLLQARQSGPKNEKKYRDNLDTALRLDPDGPSGKEARKLLDDLASAASST